jgi:hypothetical protein
MWPFWCLHKWNLTNAAKSDCFWVLYPYITYSKLAWQQRETRSKSHHNTTEWTWSVHCTTRQKLCWHSVSGCVRLYDKAKLGFGTKSLTNNSFKSFLYLSRFWWNQVKLPVWQNSFKLFVILSSCQGLAYRYDLLWSFIRAFTWECFNQWWKTERNNSEWTLKLSHVLIR